MDQDTIADLKQFIASTMSQQLALQTKDLKEEIVLEIKVDLRKLDQKIDDLDTKVDTIANTIGVQMEEDKTSVNETLDNHETRITKLEHKTA